MKKITNISLAGIAFSIEEDAYDVLKVYLAAIETHFAPLDDGDEVLADIERGISEKLSAQLSTPNAAVSLQMIEKVIEEMGRVEDIIGADEESTGGGDSARDKSDAPRKFFRDTDNAILGGVAAGIANYFAIDPTIVRLAFVIAAFINGIGILAYLILWLIVPAAKTTTEKYQMRGESVTLSHIAKQIQENVEVRVEKGRIQGIGAHISNILNAIFRFLGIIVRLFLKLLRVVFGVVLTVAGAFEIAALTVIATLLLFVVSPEVSDPITTTLMAHITNSTTGMVFVASAFVAALVVPIVAVTAGVSLLTGKNRFTVRSVLVLGVTWIIAFSIAIATLLSMLPALSTIVQTTEQAYQNEERTWHVVDLSESPEDILVRGQVSVRLVQSDEPSLRILASNETYKDVYVEQNGRSLSIERDVHFRLCFFCGVYAPYVVEIHAPNVEEFEARGNGDVLLEGVEGSALKLVLSGSFDFVAEDLVVSDLSVRASGAHDIVLGGSVSQVSFRTSGSSDFFASRLEADEIVVDTSGANTFRLQPLTLLSGEMIGGNSLYYLDIDDLEIDIDRSPEEANILRAGEVSVMERGQDDLIDQVQKTFQEVIQEPEEDQEDAQ